MTVYQRISRNLKKFRERREISQHELSRRSGVSDCLICHLEMGKRKNVTISTLEKLATALGLSTFEEFFHGQS